MIIGEKYNRLTVISEEEKINGNFYYICECECGNKTKVRGSHVLSEKIKSCGCFLKDVLEGTAEDLKDKRFGRLIVLERFGRHSSDNRITWKCKCDCGNETVVKGKDLKIGKTKSCGCLALDTRRLEKGEAAFNDLYKSYKRNAEKRNLKFELSEKEFREITNKKCFYCRKEPLQSMRRKGNRVYGEYIYNGIDRKDNALGYTVENCVPCCGRCNQAKSDQHIDDFLIWIEAIYINLVLSKKI